MEENLIELSINLYSKFVVTRKSVQFVFEQFHCFIEKTFIPFVKTSLLNNLRFVDRKDILIEIEKPLEELKNPFEGFETEKQRFKKFREK